MAKQRVRTYTKTTKRRVRKTGGNSGYRKCNMCHGTGRILKQKTTEEIMAVMDELMTTLTVVNPRLYESVIRKLTE